MQNNLSFQTKITIVENMPICFDFQDIQLEIKIIIFSGQKWYYI